MWAAIRAVVRLALVCAASCSLSFIAWLGILGLRLARRCDAGWRVRVLQLWGRTAARILGVRLRVEGVAPDAPFLLVSNHVSYLDIPVLASAARGVFVAKHDIADWPAFGAMARVGGTIFIDRGRKRDVPRVAEAIERALGDGVGVVLFPEGTSSDGSDVLPFRPPLLEPAARSGLGVHSAAISYDVPTGYPSARTSVCWAGGAPLGRHAWTLLRLPWIEAIVSFASDTIAESDRKILAESLNARVKTLHRPVRA